MDWLKDKKNQPIVIGAFVLIMLAVGAVFYMTQIADSGSSDSSADTSTQSQGMPGGPGGPDPRGAQPSAPAPTPAASPAQPSSAAAAQPAVPTGPMPMEVWRSDPFKPIGYKRVAKAPKPVPYINLPIPDMPRWHPTKPGVDTIEYTRPQPTRRMAGLLLNGRVYAIIETNGKTEVVQPGDTLLDRMAVVDRIERDKVILKTTTDKTPRYLIVRMSAAPRLDQNTPAAGAGTNPGGPATPPAYGGMRPPNAGGGMRRG